MVQQVILSQFPKHLFLLHTREGGAPARMERIAGVLRDLHDGVQLDLLAHDLLRQIGGHHARAKLLTV